MVASIGLGARRQTLPSPSTAINWSHPLAQGLVYFIIPTNRLGRTGGSGIGWNPAVNGYGRGISTSSTTSAWATPLRAHLGTVEDWTLHAFVRITSMSNYSSVAGITANPQNSGWDNPYWGLSLMRDSGSNNGHLGTNNAGTYTSTSLTTAATFVTDSEYRSYTASWGRQGGVTWRNGVQIATTTTQPFGAGSFTPQINGAPAEVPFLGRSASNAAAEGWNGTHMFQACWKRRLDQKEVVELHLNPLQLFQGNS